MENEKLTRKEVYEIAAGRPVIKAGYEKVTPLICELEKQGDAIKIGYSAGVYGWNADVWAVGPIVIVEGDRPFGDIAMDGFDRNTMKKAGARQSLADSLIHHTDLKDWRKIAPTESQLTGAKQWTADLMRDMVAVHILRGDGYRFEEKIRPVRQVGGASRKWTPYYSDDSLAILEAARALGLNVEKGNDAPRGGRLGNYITVRNF